MVKSTGVLLSFFFFLISPIAHAEIKPLGSRWAVESNADGNAISIYDLGYPTFASRVHLGSIKNSSNTFQKLKSIFEKAKENTDLDSKRIDNALGALDKLDPSTMTGNFPEHWWNQIPWKSGSISTNATEPPNSFKLSDIDFSSNVPNALEFQSAVKNLGGALGNALGKAQFKGDILEQFEFSKNDQGSYEIFWVAPEDWTDNEETPGKKIIDLQNIRSGLYANLTLEAVSHILDYALGMIKAPVVSALLSTALDRFIHFHNLMLNSHQDMVLEMLAASADEGGIFAPFTALPTESQVKAGTFLELAQTNIEDLWQWIFKTPESAFKAQLSELQNFSISTRQWLETNHQQISALSPRFDIATDPNGVKRIYLSSRSQPNSTYGPWVAFDYQKPEVITQDRIAEEIFATGVIFATNMIPIPFLGNVISSAYEYVVEGSYDKSKRAESRLISDLEERHRVIGENRNNELDHLYNQRVNPLELSRSDTENLISRRSLHLTQQTP